MTIVTHALLPLAIGRPWLRRRDGSAGYREIGIVAFCGILPDVLLFLYAWLDFRVLPRLRKRASRLPAIGDGPA